MQAHSRQHQTARGETFDTRAYTHTHTLSYTHTRAQLAVAQKSCGLAHLVVRGLGGVGCLALAVSSRSLSCSSMSAV